MGAKAGCGFKYRDRGTNCRYTSYVLWAELRSLEVHQFGYLQVSETPLSQMLSVQSPTKTDHVILSPQ